MTGSLVERSSDGGMSWFHASSGLPGVGEVEVFTMALAADPAVRQTLYTNPPFAGVYQTVNGGTWIAVNDGIAEPISALAVSPGHPSTIYAAGKGVVFHSTNGTSWTGSRTGLPQATPIVSLAADREKVYAATSSRVYQSTDGGRIWQELTAAGLTGTVSTLTVTSDHTLFAGGFGGVYRYVDATPKHRSARPTPFVPRPPAPKPTGTSPASWNAPRLPSHCSASRSPSSAATTRSGSPTCRPST